MKDETRVLAYQLAQELTVDEIEEVSGAGHQTSGPCTKLSAGTPNSWDAGVDYTWDF